MSELPLFERIISCWLFVQREIQERAGRRKVPLGVKFPFEVPPPILVQRPNPRALTTKTAKILTHEAPT